MGKSIIDDQIPGQMSIFDIMQGSGTGSGEGSGTPDPWGAKKPSDRKARETGEAMAAGYIEGILGGIEALKPAPPGIARKTAERRRAAQEAREAQKRARKRCGEDNLPCAWKDGTHCDTCEKETLPIRRPCDRRCSVECFSKTCFIRRGYIWAPGQQRGNWLRDEDGRIMIGPKQCDWIPVDGPRISATFECFAEYRTEAGGVKSGKCEKGFNDPEKPKPCSGCPVYDEFYRIAHEYQAGGKPWGEAVALTVEFLGLANVPEYMPDAYLSGIEYDAEAEEWTPRSWRQGDAETEN